ncbi:hydroxyacid dehydrogenase [Candidatus Acetothermia bacterium]|nr:hydroxyacid dehydrogenase [Candidatus Acetothermia bacterium]MBI3643358.1 hydroxyacid dehydrogenase [Candidatus Acetothermia bacterium]
MKVYLPIFAKSEDKSYLSLVNEQEDLLFLQSLLDKKVEIDIGADVPQKPEYEILVTGRPTREYLTASDKLHTLIIPFAGLPETTREMLYEFPGIKVHNLHFNADETAEMAVSLLMASAKHLIPIDRSFRQHEWGQRYENPSSSILLFGKSALVLGYGEIGQRIAKICSALGMSVRVIKRTLDMKPGACASIEIHPITELAKLLPSAEVLVIALPLTAETEGLLGKSELDLLPKDSILVNIGRGKIVDEEALYQTLKTGKIRAGLDVWYNYPRDNNDMTKTPPSRFPFHELENVVMSPHRGGHSQEMTKRRMTALADLLNLAALGKLLPNAIDVRRGY